MNVFMKRDQRLRKPRRTREPKTGGGEQITLDFFLSASASPPPPPPSRWVYQPSDLAQACRFSRISPSRMLAMLQLCLNYLHEVRHSSPIVSSHARSVFGEQTARCYHARRRDGAGLSAPPPAHVFVAPDRRGRVLTCARLCVRSCLRLRGHEKFLVCSERRFYLFPLDFALSLGVCEITFHVI